MTGIALKTRVSSLPLAGLLTCACLSELPASPVLSGHLARISDYRFTKREEIQGAGNQRRLGSYDAQILNEYVLLSYSRWSIEPSPAGRTKPGAVEMEAYELLDSPAAFGLFSIWETVNRETESRRLQIPQPHRYGPQGLVFWRGNCFFHLSDPGRSRDAGPVLARLAQRILNTIPAADVLPAAVVHLPKENQVPDSIQLYLGNKALALNPDFPAPLKPLMGLQDDIQIAAAKYGFEVTLFVIAYPTPALAAEYFIKHQNALKSHFSPQGVYLKRSGSLVGVCIGPEQEAHRVLTSLKYAPTVKWLYDRNEELAKKERARSVSLMGVVVRAIIGTALFLAVTFGLGAVVGVIRFHVMRKYPGLWKKKEMTRLKLDERDEARSGDPPTHRNRWLR